MTNSEIDDPMMALSPKQNAKQKVWSYVKNNMTSWNKFVAKQTKIADDVGVTRQYVGKALKHLEDKNYIVRNGKDQVNVVFMVNPELSWTGNKSDIAAGIAKYKEIKKDK
jgi:hypothetical protein